MKYIFIGCIGVFFCFLFLPRVFASEYLNDVNIKIINKEYDEIRLINDNSYAYTYQNITYFQYNEMNIELSTGVIKETLEDNKNYYFCIDNDNTMIIKYNKSKGNITKESIDNFVFYDWIYDEGFLMVGSVGGDAAIVKLDDDFNELERITYGGKKNELFNHILKLDEYYYLTGYKNGISEGSPFVNYGEETDNKSFILKLDNDLKWDNILYLNENYYIEYINNIICYNDHLIFSLTIKDSSYIYELDSDLNVNNYFKINDNGYVLPNYKSNNLYLFIDTKCQITESNIGNNYIVKNGVETSILKDYLLYHGKLYYAYYDNGYTYFNYIDEYEITQDDVMYCDRLYYHDDNLDGFVCESYFEKLDFEVASTSQDRLLSGLFEIGVKAIRSDGFSLMININKKVADYTNFIDGGIYKKGKVLEFFGYAFIKDEISYYGTTLNDPGVYDIRIMDYNGNNKEYRLYIVDDYYTNHQIINVPYNYSFYLDEEPFIKCQLNQNINIQSLIINDEIYDDFEVIDDVLIIHFPKELKNGIKHYYLNTIYYLDDDGILCAEKFVKHFIVNYQKRPLSFSSVENLKNDVIEIEYQFNDEDQSFLYLKTVDNNKNETLYYQNYDFEIDLNKELQIILYYTDGINLYSEELLSYDLFDGHYQGSLEFNYDNERIKKIKISLDVPKKYESITKLSVNGVSMETYYTEANKYPLPIFIIIITIGLFVVSGGIYLIAFFTKRKKKRGI